MLAELRLVLHASVNFKDDGLAIEPVLCLLLEQYPGIRDHFARQLIANLLLNEVEGGVRSRPLFTGNEESCQNQIVEDVAVTKSIFSVVRERDSVFGHKIQPYDGKDGLN